MKLICQLCRTHVDLGMQKMQIFSQWNYHCMNENDIRADSRFAPGQWETSLQSLGLRSANERWHYFVTTFLIGWVQAWNQPWIYSVVHYIMVGFLQKCMIMSWNWNTFHITGPLWAEYTHHIWKLLCSNFLQSFWPSVWLCVSGVRDAGICLPKACLWLADVLTSANHRQAFCKKV